MPTDFDARFMLILKRAKPLSHNRLSFYTILFAAVILSACTANEELRKSQDLFNKGEYQAALRSVHEAQMADPNNTQLAAFRKQVNEAIYAKEFTSIQQQYRSLPKEDLDRRGDTLKRLIKTTEALCLFNSYYSHTKTQLTHELQHVLSEKEKLGFVCRRISDDFVNDRPEQALRELATLKPYKPYLKEVSDQFDLATTVYWARVETYLDTLHRQRDFSGLKQALNLVDSVFSSDVSMDYRGKLCQFYQDKGKLFLAHGRIATAILCYSFANLFKPAAVDEALMTALFARLKDYNETIYVGLNSSSQESQGLESYREDIFRGINESFNGVFEQAASPADATLQVMVSVERLENNLIIAEPQVKYSRFVSGHKKVPNQTYYNAKEAVERARSQLTRLASESRDRTLATSVVRSDAGGDWQGILKQIDAMNSPEAFDEVPIYIDYSYLQTDIRMTSLMRISYKVHDLKNKEMVKEGTLSEQSERLVSVLEGVHPRDANGMQNSEKFDRETQKTALRLFGDKVVQALAVKIALDVAGLYESRGKSYQESGDTAEAVDSYLMGYLLKNKTVTESIALALPAELSDKLQSLTPEARQVKRLENQTFASAPSQTMDTEGGPKPERQSSPSEKKKYAEIDLPKLVKEAMRKVVLIRGVPRAKNMRGKDLPFISDTSEDGTLQGSGFMVSPNGHVITNFHVVRDCGSVFVKMHDGSEYSAKILASDSSADVALLKIPVKNTPFFALGSYKKLTAGETVIAIGSPLGLEQTVSRGIVSAKRLGSIEKGSEKLLLIQTDAQMTQGNSGGPLINLSGEAIGINTLRGPGPFGFAISTDEVRKRFPRY